MKRMRTHWSGRQWVGLQWSAPCPRLGRWWLWLLAIWGTGPSCAQLWAQSGPPASPVIRFTAFAAEPIEGLGFMAQPGGAVVPLRFFPTERSPRYEHRGRGPLRLVELRSGATVAEVVMPDGLRDVLLLLASVSDGSAGRHYRVTLLDDGPRQRIAGQIQILNLSGLDLTAEMNGRRIPVENGLNAPVVAGRSARLVLRAGFRGRSYLSWHDTVSLGTSERALLILFPPYLPGSLEVQTRVLLDEPPAVRL